MRYVYRVRVRVEELPVIECVEWGGCERFVWSVYALGFLTVAGLSIWPILSLRRTLDRLRRRALLDAEDSTEVPT